MEKSIYRQAQRLEQVNFSPVRKVLERANQLAASGRDILHFEIGEPDFETPKEIVEATVRALTQQKLTHYGPNRGILPLRKAIAKRLLEENGVRVDAAEEILLTVGAAEAIFDVILGLIGEGDEVIIFTPAYMNYENCIQMAGAVCVKLELREENGYQIDEQALRQAVTPRTRMIVLTNPNNPTGTVHRRECLEAVARVAREHDLAVLSDEIYEKLVYGGTAFCSMASLEGMGERTITVNGFSKAYAMTGWRLGYVACDKRFIPAILKVHQYTTTCVPTFIQYGLAEGMEEPGCAEAVAAMVDTFRQRRVYVLGRLDAMDRLSYAGADGAFYVFVNVSGTGLDGDAFAVRLLEEQGVALVPGSGFGDGCGDYVRISFAASMENLAAGLDRIQRFVDALPTI